MERFPLSVAAKQRQAALFWQGPVLAVAFGVVAFALGISLAVLFT